MNALSQLVLRSTVTLADITTDASGVTYCEATGTLFVVNNSTCHIFEYSSTGDLLREISTTGFTDVEDIAWTSGIEFALVEEGNAVICLVDINDDTTALDKTADATPIDTGLGALGNTGLEGLTYDRVRDCFYAVKEKTPLAVYQVLRDGTTTELFSAALLPADITDLSGCHYDHTLDQLYLLSQEAESILLVTLDGSLVTRSEIPDPMTQPEGLVFSENGRHLWLVGEPNELQIYTAPGSPVLPSEFTALIPDPNEEIQAIIAKFFAQAFLWEQWRRYAFSTDNKITTAWEADLAEGRNRFATNPLPAAGTSIYRTAGSPTLAELIATLPTNDKTVCAKLSGIPDIINVVSDDVTWSFTDAGDFSNEFRLLLCGLKAFQPVDTGPCPDIALVGDVLGGNRLNRVIFQAASLPPGYTWTLEWKLIGGVYATLSSGITDGSSIQYTHENLENGVPISYQMTVAKSGCAAVPSAEVIGTPSGCDSPNVTLALSSTAVGTVQVALSGIPSAGWTVLIYYSLDPVRGWSAAPASSVGEYIYEVTGLNEPQRYYFFATLRDPSGECESQTGKNNSILPMAPEPVPPSITISGHTVQWNNVAGAVSYRVYRNAVWWVTESWTPTGYSVAPGNGGVAGFNLILSQWPANFPTYGTRTKRSYQIAVVSVNASGQESARSNNVLFEEEI